MDGNWLIYVNKCPPLHLSFAEWVSFFLIYSCAVYSWPLMYTHPARAWGPLECTYIDPHTHKPVHFNTEFQEFLHVGWGLKFLYFITLNFNITFLHNLQHSQMVEYLFLFKSLEECLREMKAALRNLISAFRITVHELKDWKSTCGLVIL